LTSALARYRFGSGLILFQLTMASHKTVVKNKGIKGKTIWLLKSVKRLTKPRIMIFEVSPLKKIPFELIFSNHAQYFITSSTSSLIFFQLLPPNSYNSSSFIIYFHII